ncbi:exo-beta-N-acetylmuramidase NamZ family protein [Gorillibacterium timonense]|uniref:exo-beta-N-acetylmuramidase NamZ family protein n=1 Tax=Gorillibacterium timonense TaxID=1689269 RepID=UPI00071CCD3F|nr:DUF1343 domain-containing protein [Gorillibacterium timonense]
MVRNGVDCLTAYDPLFKGKRLGLITSPTGRTTDFVSTIELLNERYHLTALFSPEHGVRGDQEAGGMVETYTDEITGVPVYSLYRKDSKRMTTEMLEQVDAVVYDIQDVGVRYYTFIYTMLYALEDCAKAGKAFIVLDRLNPLGGTAVEGNLLKDDYRSFVGNYPLCIRYGLTVGEFAMMANEQMGLKADLHIARCEGWERDMLFPDTGRLWLHPSIGLPRFETALLYAGTCLFEGTNLSEGRGTTFPFEMIGAPFLDAERLTVEMNRFKLPGVYFRPAYFKPSFSKHQGAACKGVQLHVTNARSIRPVETGIRLLDVIRRQNEEFSFLSPIREGARPFIDLLGGDRLLRDETLSADSILEQFRAESEAFAEKKKAYHLYY